MQPLVPQMAPRGVFWGTVGRTVITPSTFLRPFVALVHPQSLCLFFRALLLVPSGCFLATGPGSGAMPPGASKHVLALPRGCERWIPCHGFLSFPLFTSECCDPQRVEEQKKKTKRPRSQCCTLQKIQTCPHHALIYSNSMDRTGPQPSAPLSTGSDSD